MCHALDSPGLPAERTCEGAGGWGLTKGTLWGCTERALAWQVCRLAAQVGRHIMAKFALVSKWTGSFDEAVTNARCPLLSRFLTAKRCCLVSQNAIR